MKIRLDSVSFSNTKSMIEAGKLVKIEFYATAGDGFAERCAKFLRDVGGYTAGGASRSIGILDATEDGEKAMKLFIDGDGADRIRDVTINGIIVTK